MTDYNSVFSVQVIHQTDQVLAKHLRCIVDGRFARLPGATVIMDDYAMIPGKFRHLVDLPNLAVAGRFAQKHHGPAPTILFVIDLGFVYPYRRHLLFSSLRVYFNRYIVEALRRSKQASAVQSSRFGSNK